MNETLFNNFVAGLVLHEKPLDPNLTRIARKWYTDFTGPHAVKLSDREVVDLYSKLSTD